MDWMIPSNNQYDLEGKAHRGLKFFDSISKFQDLIS